MRFLYGVLTTLVVLALGGVLFVFSGLYNVSAREDHSSLETWAMHTTMHNSVQSRAQSIEEPDDLMTEERIRQGARGYDQLCAACHLKPGQSDSLIRQGLNPQPPLLTRAGHWSAAEKFWIIKNGIKMTGMPAWGGTHEDDDLWEITAFLQRLPELSEQQYADLVQPDTSGSEPADDGHDHVHSDMSGMTGANAGLNASGAAAKSNHGEESPGHHGGNSAGQRGHDDMETEEDDHGDSARQTESVDKDSQSEKDDHYADGHSH